MAISILSWNIKSFVSCLTFGGDRLTVIEKVMCEFDLIFIYQVPHTVNGNTSVKDLLKNLDGVGGHIPASGSIRAGRVTRPSRWQFSSIRIKSMWSIQPAHANA